MPSSTKKPVEDFRVGLVVDAGPALGYGHAVRCLRIANEYPDEAVVIPLSQPCRRFFEANGFGAAIADTHSEGLPPLVITDLRYPHAIAGSIQRHGSIHVSIHDMGLAQCSSEVAIDGSVAHAVPYSSDSLRQARFLGPQYMITRPVVARADESEHEDVVLVTLGGGASAEFACRIAEHLQPLGLRVVTTSGFAANPRLRPVSEAEIVHTMAHCRFAISTAGTTLYDLLASSVPVVAVAVDRLQLRTADKFQEMGAVLSAGLLDRLSPAELLEQCRVLRGNSGLVSRMVSIGRSLVDGQGLHRVVEIVNNSGREIWKMRQARTSTVC